MASLACTTARSHFVQPTLTKDRQSITKGITLSSKFCGINHSFAGNSTQKSGLKRTLVTNAVTEESAALQEKFGAEGILIDAGEGELTRITLSTPSKSAVEIYLYGGVPTSWKVPSGKDLLFVRPDAVFTGKKPISGGLPHCFPQFGPGAIQQHGFARNSFWTLESVTGGATPSATLKLQDNEYTRGMWDFGFEALFTISLTDSDLSTLLEVKNTDSKPFDFTAALHSYFRADISKTEVKGLKGLNFLNKDPDPKNPIPGIEDRDSVTFSGYVDSVYLDAPAELTLENGLGTSLVIANENWKDAVVWNPHLTMEACYKDFVCVENAQIAPVTLGAGESWTAKQVLTPK